ncbi:MAG: hypothetical protein WCH83_16070, partial [Alphaproteobacteria bacterium]
LSQAVRGIRAGDPAAFWGLVSLSFLYGVFHAAGPGHGKAVISSYIVSTGETLRRGMLLAGLSSLVQALVAILLVTIASVLLGATARSMTSVINWIEMAAYALVALIGLRLVWTKGRAFWIRVSAWWQGRPVAGIGCDDACVHLPSAEQAARVTTWRDTVQVVLAVGLRPCTGAVLVLVFSLAQGILYAGIVATLVMAVGTAITVAAIAIFASSAKSLAVRFAGARPGLGTLFLSLIEVIAAVVVVIFGAALLTGTWVLERAAPF